MSSLLSRFVIVLAIVPILGAATMSQRQATSRSVLSLRSENGNVYDLSTRLRLYVVEQQYDLTTGSACVVQARKDGSSAHKFLLFRLENRRLEWQPVAECPELPGFRRPPRSEVKITSDPSSPCPRGLDHVVELPLPNGEIRRLLVVTRRFPPSEVQIDPVCSDIGTGYAGGYYETFVDGATSENQVARLGLDEFLLFSRGSANTKPFALVVSTSSRRYWNGFVGVLAAQLLAPQYDKVGPKERQSLIREALLHK